MTKKTNPQEGDGMCLLVGGDALDGMRLVRSGIS